ncbi:MAG TPA: desulfoferrodoxin family protein [Noviherbaspirillum sp.]|nr:desulfoferrodoxin family protein [Noviherbaspirillum sp.]
MQNETRRSFVKSALAGAVFTAVGTPLARPALAAEDIKEVKFAQDPKNLKPGPETSHTPSIMLEKVDSKMVAYGKTPPGDFYRVIVQARHEATNEHHIFGIALYLNGKLIAEHTMNRTQVDASLPAVTFVQRLKAGDNLLAVTDCNIHGKWGNRTTV